MVRSRIHAADSQEEARAGRIPVTGPIGGGMIHVIRGLLVRGRLTWLLNRYDRLPVMAAFSCINGFISICLMALLAVVTGSPFIFPSLGPTAFLFFYTPLAPSASPRNTVVGHAIGVAAGYGSLVVTGLTQAPPAVGHPITLQRALAAALSLGATAGLMVLLRSPHPPAGATTLIVSLGILAAPPQLLILLLGVVLLVLQAIVINQAAGLPYPLWNPVARSGDSETPSGKGAPS